MSSIFIQDITIGTKLTWHWKVRDQIDTIERLKTKLKYIVKNKNQIYSLPKILQKFDFINNPCFVFWEACFIVLDQLTFNVNRTLRSNIKWLNANCSFGTF